jgi:hypothetical protein
VHISRRNFLGTATASTFSLWFRSIGLHRPGSRHESNPDYVLLDLQSDCLLRESFRGYQTELAQHACLTEVKADLPGRCRMTIIPGCGLLEPTVAETLLDLLTAGNDLLLESGVGFCSSLEFAAHQKLLHDYFDITVERPVDLWSGKTAHDRLMAEGRRADPWKWADQRGAFPYVNYIWPRDAAVRDFSRIIPVSTKSGEVIARAGPWPVALRKRFADASLIFLGSPLGPALLAGDAQARSWLRSVIRPDPSETRSIELDRADCTRPTT